jgi:protein TonB
MNYTRALFISCFLHGLAFAGYWFSTGTLGTTLGTGPVEVFFAPPSPPISPVIKPIIPFEKQEKAMKKPKGTPSVIAPQEANSVDGADLVPNPANKPISYPEIARQRGIEGQALVTLTLDSIGQVMRVDFSSPLHAILQKAVEETVRTWHFQRLKTSPSYVTLSVPVAFSLTGEK